MFYKDEQTKVIEIAIMHGSTPSSDKTVAWDVSINATITNDDTDSFDCMWSQVSDIQATSCRMTRKCICIRLSLGEKLVKPKEVG